jgi:recombination associated protein RdgC
LPSSVIKEILDERIEEIKIREARKVSGREKKDMREQVEFELLPRAFTRTRQLDAWIDTKKGWIVLNTSSTVQAERFTGLMRKVLDSFPVAAPDTDQSPTFVMSNWLSEGVLPAPFELGEGCELCSQGDDRSVATFKKHELLSDVVQSNLGAGKLCSKLSLVWDDRLSFTMTESLLIKGVKFLDVFKEQVNDQDPQTQAECKDIEFALMTGAFRNLFADISKAFGVSEPAGKE